MSGSLCCKWIIYIIYIISDSYIQRKSWPSKCTFKTRIGKQKKKISKSSLSYPSNDSPLLLVFPGSNPTTCSAGLKEPTSLQGSQLPSCSKLRKRSDQQQVGEPVPLIMAQSLPWGSKIADWKINFLDDLIFKLNNPYHENYFLTLFSLCLDFN